MSRYFLNLTNAHGPLKDEEGIEAPDLERARIVATDNVRGALSHEVLEGKLDLRGHIDIVDTEDQILATIPFNEAVQVLLP